MIGHRLALVAFGCSPEGGSENRSGWQWANDLAACGHQVTVFTNAANRVAVESIGAVDGVDFGWIDSPSNAIGNAFPACRSSSAYLTFLKRAGEVIRAQHLEHPFTTGLHVSWSQIRSGTPLSEVAGLRYIMGPVGGGQTMSVRLAIRYLGLRATLEMTRNVEVCLAPLSRRAGRGCRRAALVVAANLETARLASRPGAANVVVKTDGGINKEQALDSPLPSLDDGLEVLWVGRLLPRKGLALALEPPRLEREHAPIQLTIAGDGADGSLLDDLPPGVELLGQVRPAALPELFASSHEQLDQVAARSHRA